MASRRHRFHFGVLLLAGELYQNGLHHIPPVTLATVAVNVLGYLGLIPLLSSPGSACVSFVNVWRKHQYKRLLLASFVHLDDMHLYYNMVSLIWKGKSLERKLGSTKFAIVIAIFSILTQVIMLVLNKILATYIFFDSDYLYHCAAGFSAVLFALKVLTTHYMPTSQTLPLGLPIPVHPKFACWIELLVIQILVPNASFTGHLAGILVGLMYVNKLTPLNKLVNLINSSIAGRRGEGYARPRSTGTKQQNFGGLDEDKDLQEAIRRSLQDSHISQRYQPSPPPPGWNIGGSFSENHGYAPRGRHPEPPYPPSYYSSMAPFSDGDRSLYDSPHPSAPSLEKRDT